MESKLSLQIRVVALATHLVGEATFRANLHGIFNNRRRGYERAPLSE